jgi:hypothetical protein
MDKLDIEESGMSPREISSGCGKYKNITILRWLVTQDEQRHFTTWIESITGKTCENRWISISETAIVASNPGPQGMQRSGFFNHRRYQRNHGKIFQWILWWAYQNAKGLMQYGW